MPAGLILDVMIDYTSLLANLFERCTKHGYIVVKDVLFIFQTGLWDF
jgi:hypothetical protein